MNKKNRNLLEKLNKNATTHKSAIDRFKRKRKKELIIISFILSLLLLIFWFINSSHVKLKYINVSGLNQLTEKEILEKTNINNTVKIWEIKESDVENTIKTNYNIVESVSVDVKWLQTININIKERKILAREKNEDGNYSYILDSGDLYENNMINEYNVPIIENIAKDENIKKELLKNLFELKQEILIQISEIVVPKEDSSTSIIYMKDGQKVKVNSVNFSSKLNYYNEMAKHIEEKNNTTLNLVNGAYLETNQTVIEKENKIKQILAQSNNPKIITENNIINSNTNTNDNTSTNTNQNTTETQKSQ